MFRVILPLAGLLVCWSSASAQPVEKKDAEPFVGTWTGTSGGFRETCHIYQDTGGALVVPEVVKMTHGASGADASASSGGSPRSSW